VKVFKLATLFAAAAAVALVGCKRAKHTSNPLAKAPVQAAPAAHAAPVGYVYITNNGEGTVSELGRQADGSLVFLRAAKAGAVDGPTGIAVDPSNRFLYVANEGDGRIYQFRIKRDTGDLAMVGEGSVDDGPASRPQQIAISPHGDFVYVTNAGKGADGSIAEYMIKSATGALKPLEIFRSSGLQQPLGIAITPNGNFVYVSDSGAGTIVVFAVESSGELKQVGSTPSLGDRTGQPGLVAVHPSGSFVYTVDRSLGTVAVFKTTADGKLSATKTYHVGISTAGPFGIALAAVGPDVFVYTANRGVDTVSSLIVKSGGLELVGECPTGMGYPTGMMADPSGHFFYVVNRDASTVTQFTIAETNGVALFPAVTVFTEVPVNEASHPLYIAMTRWDAAPSVAHSRGTQTN
jgi:6-phosphogluconolactonase